MTTDTEERLKSLLETQDLAKAGVIWAPASFKLATEQQLLEVCNGCGAEGSWFRPPSTIWSTSIIAACHIHDWCYWEGRTAEDKVDADEGMLNNMLRLIEKDKKWYKPTRLQRNRAGVYYLAVVRYGGPAFWSGKP